MASEIIQFNVSIDQRQRSKMNPFTLFCGKFYTKKNKIKSKYQRIELCTQFESSIQMCNFVFLLTESSQLNRRSSYVREDSIFDRKIARSAH